MSLLLQIQSLFRLLTLLISSRDSERDTFSLSFHTLDPHSPNPTYPLIAVINKLPSSSISLLPCPPHISGCLLTTPNALVHIDPSGNTLASAVNLYHVIESSLPAPRPPPAVTGIRLEGSRVVFLEEGKKALLVLKEGDVRELVFEKEGRMLVRIGVGETAVGKTSRPGGEVSRIDVAAAGKGAKEGEVVFVGGVGGEGVLLRVGREGGAEAVKVETFLRQALLQEEDEMDIEDGESAAHFLTGLCTDASPSLLFQTSTDLQRPYTSASTRLPSAQSPPVANLELFGSRSATR